MLQWMLRPSAAREVIQVAIRGIADSRSTGASYARFGRLGATGFEILFGLRPSVPRFKWGGPLVAAQTKWVFIVEAPARLR